LAPALLGAGVVLMGLAACVHVQPRPVVPDQALQAFAARSLDEAGLREFFSANHTAVPAAGAAWGLEPLALAAFYFNPDLDMARAELATAEAARVTAGERPNPSLALSAGYNSTTSPSLVSPWILTFNLDIPLTTAGKRGHRIAAARSLAQAARYNLAAAAWQVRSRVRASLVELSSVTESETLLAEQEAIEQEIVTLLERQLEAGAVSSNEVTQAHLALAAMQLSRRDAGARVLAGRAQLADAVGITAQALGGVTLSFTDLERAEAEIPSQEARRQTVLNRADVLAALAEVAASQAALQLELARQYPDINLGPGYEFDQGDNKWIVAISLPLPIVSRNRGPIAEAEARRGAAAARFVAVQAHAVGQVDQAVASYEVAAQAAVAAERMGDDLRSSERIARARFEAGEISRLELDGALLERTTAALARLEARVRAEVALGQLEDAMQRSTQPLDWLSVPPNRGEAPEPGAAGSKP
jgi:cobalt-zinc-cadmium efflux system outer membrane protein